MTKALWLCLLVAGWLAMVVPALAEEGTISYRARIVHNNRTGQSIAEGALDLTTGDFQETIIESANLDWTRIPGQSLPTIPALPDIYRVNSQVALRQGGGIPSYNNPILRHFIVGEVIRGVEQLSEGQYFLFNQLRVESLEVRDTSFELVASFRSMPLVVVGERGERDGLTLVTGLVVLGPGSELYQYYFDEITYSAEALQTAIALPAYSPTDFIEFPEGGSTEVAIRPVKDWLVFQAQLPNGRPLNLIFDSGAERMILDDLVLRVDALLEPTGDLPVAGAFSMDTMQLYTGFSFEVGGVTFKDLDVIGTQLTTFGIGAETRIHGIVGNEILQLCQLDLDLEAGTMQLKPAAGEAPTEGTELELTFIEELPHVTADVNHSGSALLLLDTGMGSPLAVNLDWLDAHELGDDLMMNGFMGDIAGGLAPRYLLENMDISLAGQDCEIRPVDASPDPTFTYGGMQVIGSIGFPMLASHFGGITFDYSRQKIYLRDPGQELVFAGQPDVWVAQQQSQFDQMQALGLNYTAPGFVPQDPSEANPIVDPAGPEEEAAALAAMGPPDLEVDADGPGEPTQREAAAYSDIPSAIPAEEEPGDASQVEPSESHSMFGMFERLSRNMTEHESGAGDAQIGPPAEPTITDRPATSRSTPPHAQLPEVSERPDLVVSMAHIIANALAAKAYRFLPELLGHDPSALASPDRDQESDQPADGSQPPTLFTEFSNR